LDSNGYFKTFENVPVDQLEEHPRNAQYYGPMDETMWEMFLADIAENGITTPIKYNTRNNYVIAGNQRLQAARELEFETIPAIGVHLETTEEELIELIRDNDLRRKDTLDKKIERISAFRELVSKLRKEHPEQWKGTRTQSHVKKTLGVSDDLYRLSMAIQNMPEEDRQKVLEYAKVESRTEAEIKEKVEELEARIHEQKQEKKSLREGYHALIAKIEDRYGARYNFDTGELEFSSEEEKPSNAADLQEQIDGLLKQKQKVEQEAQKAREDRDLAFAQRRRAYNTLGVFRKLYSKLEVISKEIAPVEWNEELRAENETMTRQFLAEIDRVVELVHDRMLPGGSHD
jgi:ParB-like chromosome segregation protein Spo0J